MRERARYSGPPTEEEQDSHHRIDLAFQLSPSSLNNLSSEQLLAVPFHPDATPALEAKAQKLFRRRRERDFAAGNRYSKTPAPVVEVQPAPVADIKPALPAPSPAAESAPNPSEPLQHLPLPVAPTPTPVVARSPSPILPPARSPSPPPLPPLPSPETRLPPHLASHLHTLYLSNLPTTIQSRSDLRAIFSARLRPDTSVLLRAETSADGVALPRRAYAAWKDFDKRTDAMQAAVSMRLGEGGRWVPTANFVESSQAQWEWGDLDRETKEAYWRKEHGQKEVFEPQEAPAPAPAEVEPEAALLAPPSFTARSPSLPPAPPALSTEYDIPPPQPQPTTVSAFLPGGTLNPAAPSSAPNNAVPSTTPAFSPPPIATEQPLVDEAAPAAPIAHVASPAPSDSTPAGSPLPEDWTAIPPRVVKTWHQLTYSTSDGVVSRHPYAVGGLQYLSACIGTLSPSPNVPPGNVQYVAFLKAADRDRAVKTLLAKGQGTVVDATAGVLEGWSRSNLTSKFRNGEQARGKGNGSAAISKKRSREEEDDRMKGDNSDEGSSKQARLDSVAESSVNAATHQRMDTPQGPPPSRTSTTATTTTSTASLVPSTFSTSVVPDLTSPARLSAETSDPPLPQHFDPYTDESARLLPSDWRREQSRSTGEFFFARDDGFTTWENPLDEVLTAEQQDEEDTRPIEPLSDMVIDDEENGGDDDEEGLIPEPTSMDVSQAANAEDDRSPAPQYPSIDPPSPTTTQEVPPAASEPSPAQTQAATGISFRLPPPTSSAAPLPATSVTTTSAALTLASRLSSSPPPPPTQPRLFAAPAARPNPQPTLAARTALPIDIRGSADPDSVVLTPSHPPHGPASSTAAGSPLADRLGARAGAPSAPNSTRNAASGGSHTGAASLIARLDSSLPTEPAATSIAASSKKEPPFHPPSAPTSSLQSRMQPLPDRPGRPAPASSTSLLERARLPSNPHASSSYARSPPHHSNSNDRYTQPIGRAHSPPRGPRYASNQAYGNGRGGGVGSLGRHSIEDTRRPSGGGRGGQGGGGDLLDRIGR